MPEQAVAGVLRALWREKLHVEPTALDLAPAAIAASYAHIWQPAEVLLAELEPLPAGLLSFWLGAPRGHVVLTHQASCYRPGPQPWHAGTLESVSYVSVVDLRRDKAAAIGVVLNLLDHLWGGWAAVGQPYLSDGAGVSAALSSVGQRFVELYALGYGRESLGADSARDYLARTLWLYLHDPQRLNVLDPLLCKLYRHTLLNPAFWPGS